MPKFRPGRVLVAYKKSAYEAYFDEYKPSGLKRAFEAGDVNLAHLKRSHAEHYGTVREVLSALQERGLSVEAKTRGELHGVERYGFIVTVGGDGTLLEAARSVDRQPVLGVNSDPNHSVGKLCRADRRSFARILDRLLDGKAKVVEAARLSLRLDGRPLKEPVLNDVLVAHSNPAAMSHYVIAVGKRREQHRSSGVWVATAAGSTGAAFSAGGRALAVASSYFQYVPRELYYANRYGYRLRGGVLGADRRILLRSLMREGAIFPDGAHRRHAFPYGSELEIAATGKPLRVVVS